MQQDVNKTQRIRPENENRAALSGECFYRVGTLAWLRHSDRSDRMKSEGNAPWESRDVQGTNAKTDVWLKEQCPT